MLLDLYQFEKKYDQPNLWNQIQLRFIQRAWISKQIMRTEEGIIQIGQIFIFDSLKRDSFVSSARQTDK